MSHARLGIWILAALVCSGLLAQSDARSVFGPKAPVMEAMVALVFPGSTIDWEGPRLQGPGFGPKPLEFIGYTEQEWQEALVSAAAIQFPQEIREIVATALEGGDLGSRVTRSHVAVVRLAQDRSVVEGRTAALDVGGVATEVQSLFIFPDPEEPSSLPPIDVEFKSFHVGPDWVASMGWIGTLEGEPLAATRLIPVLVSFRNKDGAVATDVLEIEEPSATELILRGSDSGFTWTFNCDPDCLVPAETILAEYKDKPILAE